VTDLEADFAIGENSPAGAETGLLRIAERSDISIASLALRKGAAVPQLFGLSLPGPGEWVSENTNCVLWSGPGQWLVLAERHADGEPASELKASCPSCSVTEQTDGWVVIDIECQAGGDMFAEMLARLANIDPDKLSQGRCVRTLLHHLGCHLVRLGPRSLRILGARSSAGSLWHAIETVAVNLDCRFPVR
jgi:heterotetrameric sarcosine oxidase gamma subunit